MIDHMPSWAAAGFRSDSFLARASRPILNRIVPEGQTVVIIRSGPGKGLSLPIMPETEKYYWSGTHERHVQDAIVDLLNEGMCFWDIGAHIGFISIIAARQVGESGTVVAFEPMPESRARLTESIRLNGFTNVIVKDYALGDTNETRMLHPPRLDESDAKGTDSRGSTLMWTLDSDRGDNDGISVDCRRIDDLVGEIEPPDLIKVDAEGVEIEVLAGGVKQLARGGTKVIVEMSDAETLERGRSLLPDYRFDLIGANHWLLS
ncbi:MAG: FkbM family methyltransferase [Thermoleophilia bacterium]|nr:FkbM family methyltransferase [Thermoleophilia bacterium]